MGCSARLSRFETNVLNFDHSNSQIKKFVPLDSSDNSNSFTNRSESSRQGQNYDQKLFDFEFSACVMCQLSSLLLFLLLFPLNFLLFLEQISALDRSSESDDDECRICQFLTTTFLEGLDKTEKLHFGGGNTDWEERKLGKFKTSETRFVEIMEYVCKKSDSFGFGGIKDIKFKCHSLAEKHEELLEKWFFEHQDNGPSIEEFLCIYKLEFCCEKEHFGKDCSHCPGLKQSGKSCFGRGRCQGNGSRSGNGTCSCDRGYIGKMCSNCESNYFAVSQNSTHITCEECFDGCTGGCTAAGPLGCRDCRSGYSMEPEVGCKDIDECSNGENCQKENEMCFNTPGSFECRCTNGFRRSESGECELDIEEFDKSSENPEEKEVSDERSNNGEDSEEKGLKADWDEERDEL